MKIRKFVTPYTQSPNQMLSDKNLSWQAKGLWTYIQSKPDSWDFSSERMSSESTDGLRATRSALKELEVNGYLRRLKLTDGRMEYELYEDPKLRFSTEAKRHSAKTSPISNKDLNTNKELNKNKEITTDSPSEEKPFSLEAEIKFLEDSNRRDFNVIALYFENRRPTFENKKQYNFAFRRHLKDAKVLKEFSDTQILEALKYAKKEYPKIYTVGTLVKILTK